MLTFPPEEHDGPPSNRAATAAHAYPFLFSDEDREEALRTRAVCDARFFTHDEPRTPAEGVEAGRQVVEDLLAGKLLDAAIGPSDRPRKGSLLRCVTREEVAYASPLADAILAVQGLGTHPLALTRKDAPELLQARRGAAVFGFAVTEPDAGSDVSRIAVKACPERGTSRGGVKSGTGWRITGTKVFISNAGIATHYTVFARTAEGKKGVSCFLVEAAKVKTELLDLNAPHPVGVLHFEDTPGSLLGDEGQGISLALGTLDVFRPSVGAAAIGMGRRALDEAMLHVAQRTQFGAPLIENAQVQALLADAATALEGARALVYRAAWKNDKTDEKATLESAMGKLAATEAAQKAVDLAVQLSGGLGVLRGRTVEHLYRAVRALRIYEGASEVMKLVIARELRR
ncbi:MAG: acyl-CoA dehydrogenase family protein [Planctomycetota bacterium]